MSSSRLETLLKYYNEEPDDPFNIYALAIEYLNHDLEKARPYFNQLLDEHPSYLPTYYHAAKFFQTMNEREKTISVFERGITLAKEQKEYKALRELQSAYDEFLYE